MDRSTRIAVVALAGVALLCALAAIATKSIAAAVAALIVTAVAGFIGFIASHRRGHTPAATQHFAYVPPVPASPSSTATVIVPPGSAQLAEESGPTRSPKPATQALLPAAEPTPVEPAEPPVPLLPQPIEVAAQPSVVVAQPTASAQVDDTAAQSPMPAMPQGVEPDDVLECLLENASVAGTPVSAHLWLEDPGSETLRLVCAVGSARPDGTPEPIVGSVLGRSLEAGHALLQPLWRMRSADEDRLTWRFAVPLLAGEARGVAAVDLRGTTRPDGDALVTVSAALRGALTGALALHVARTESTAARTLLETASELSRLVEPDAVLQTTLERAMQLAHAETGSIMLRDETRPSRMRIAVSAGLPDEVVSSTEISEGEGIAGWVLASGQPLVVEDLNGRGPRSRRHGVRSAISVPLADKDGVLGVVNVGSRAFHARFSRSHLEALEALARTAAVAYRNASAVTTTQDLYFDTLKALALAMETKDPYALGGTERVIEFATALGEAMGLTPSESQALRIAATLHDIGMSAAGDVVAVSNRPLSTVEWGMLKMHPVIASDILSQAPALRAAVPIVYHHHEHYDGRGYVVGLAGHQIPLGARILAVADAYVAMTSDRPYRKAMTHEHAIGELESEAGSQFDPEVVRAFVELTGSEVMRSASQP